VRFTKAQRPSPLENEAAVRSLRRLIEERRRREGIGSKGSLSAVAAPEAAMLGELATRFDRLKRAMPALAGRVQLSDEARLLSTRAARRDPAARSHPAWDGIGSLGSRSAPRRSGWSWCET
jgi:hypothetical protein